VDIGVAGDASGIFQASGSMERRPMRGIVELLRETGPIDLIKINVEGAEYEILEKVLDHGLAGQLHDIQVQFHGVVPDAAARRDALRGRLVRTHRLTYDFPFVWENWRRTP
jgi:hypothetical protein